MVLLAGRESMRRGRLTPVRVDELAARMRPVLTVTASLWTTAPAWVETGCVSCAEIFAQGIGPVERGYLAYTYMRDSDGSGIMYEQESEVEKVPNGPLEPDSGANHSVDPGQYP